jgi:hypothetical protein
MNLKTIAKMIPEDYRKEILLTNMIGTAIASTSDSSMMYLGKVWKEYVAPEEKLDCGLCLERVLNNYRQLQPIFIELEKESKLLDSI